MENLMAVSKKYAVSVGLGIVGLICLIYGLTTFWQEKPPDKNFSSFTAKQKDGESATKLTDAEPIIIDIAGAVNQPGVYTLPSESRVKDAIEKAGGLHTTADTDLIARQFNLAMKLTDGMKLYLPSRNENITTIGGAEEKSSSQNTLNINSASETELDRLTGVGKVTATKIVAGRPYTTIDELVEKKILSQKIFDQIKTQITTF